VETPFEEESLTSEIRSGQPDGTDLCQFILFIFSLLHFAWLIPGRNLSHFYDAVSG